MRIFFTICVIVCILKRSFNCQLIVNVKNLGGEIYKEFIDANTTQDLINLEFRLSDGSIVNQFIDAKNEIQIFKITILPEEEYGQTKSQTLCFVLRFLKNEFISSDAMSKLRQKNPSAIRHPEENQKNENYQMDIMLGTKAYDLISPFINSFCSSAINLTFSRQTDIRLISQILNLDTSFIQSEMIFLPTPPAPDHPLCSGSTNFYRPCSCSIDACVGWYPCGLKYCKGKDSTNRLVNYRCGIKTCSKCYSFQFYVQQRFYCSWQEDIFNSSTLHISDA